MVADYCANCYEVAAHYCCEDGNRRVCVARQIPTPGRLFLDSSVFVLGVKIGLPHGCLRIGREMTDACHLVVAY